MENSKLNNNLTLRLKQIGACISTLFTITIICSVIYFSLNLPYKDITSPFTYGDYFWFDGRRLSLLTAVPFLIYIIYLLLITKLSKKKKGHELSEIIGSILSILSVALLVVLNIFFLFVYLYIAIFTQYKPCEDPKLKHYFVTDYAICKTIVNNDFN